MNPSGALFIDKSLVWNDCLSWIGRSDNLSREPKGPS